MLPLPVTRRRGRPPKIRPIERSAGSNEHRSVSPPPVEMAESAPPPLSKGGAIRRFTADMIDRWFLDRLEKVRPGLSAANWIGRFAGFQASNDYLCICNDRVVLFASRQQQPITGSWLVVVWFCWSRDNDEFGRLINKYHPAAQALYDFCRRWLSDMGGERMICGLSDDRWPYDAAEEAVSILAVGKL